MSHSWPCEWKKGFVMDPKEKHRIGYIYAFDGLGLTKALDLDVQVFAPFSGKDPTPTAAKADATTKAVKVVGVIENLSWGGGVGDAFSLSCYMSSQNAHQLKALRTGTLTTTAIKSVGWWIGNYDEEKKEWYEEHYPKTSSFLISCQLNAVNTKDVRLHVADEGTKVAANIDAKVYNVYMEFVPAANQLATFLIAAKSTVNVVKNWGMVVGADAVAALPAQT